MKSKKRLFVEYALTSPKFKKFKSVDFRGINDNTLVKLSIYIPCSTNSNNDNNESDLFCPLRTKRKCTGERKCLESCQCFEIPDDWQPALNDFYTYVLCNKVCCFVSQIKIF